MHQASKDVLKNEKKKMSLMWEIAKACVYSFLFFSKFYKTKSNKERMQGRKVKSWIEITQVKITIWYLPHVVSKHLLALKWAKENKNLTQIVSLTLQYLVAILTQFLHSSVQISVHCTKIYDI